MKIFLIINIIKYLCAFHIFLSLKDHLLFKNLSNAEDPKPSSAVLFGEEENLPMFIFLQTKYDKFSLIISYYFSDF